MELSNNQTVLKGEIGTYKVIKITGPYISSFDENARELELLSCTIIPSDSASYSYQYYINNQESTGENRMILKQVGDTLVVKYLSFEAKNNDHVTYYNNPVNVTLYLPVLNKIIVENANVAIDSVHTFNNAEISFDLRNQANLQLGNFGHSQTVFGSGNTESDIHESMDNPTFDSTHFRERSGKLSRIEINASNASFTVGPYAWIKDLQLRVNGQSQVNIANNSRIDQLSGFISDSSAVNASWKNIRRLAALTEK